MTTCEVCRSPHPGLAGKQEGEEWVCDCSALYRVVKTGARSGFAWSWSWVRDVSAPTKHDGNWVHKGALEAALSEMEKSDAGVVIEALRQRFNIRPQPTDLEVTLRVRLKPSYQSGDLLSRAVQHIHSMSSEDIAAKVLNIKDVSNGK